MYINWILEALYLIIFEINNTLANTTMISTNITAIKWAHGVNNMKDLDNALKSNIDMIEADIVTGKLIKNQSGAGIPIMAHPPSKESDLSLDVFLKTVAAHNKNKTTNIKGVKLDFKTIEVFKNSKAILKTQLQTLNCPIWLNADILPGPVNAVTLPVHADQFLEGCKEFKNITLSLGWTTMWGKNFTNGFYSKNQINDMVALVKKNNIINQHITFPVRAGIAANSLNELNELVKQSNPTNKATLTIWTSKDDNIDIVKLKKLILTIGVNKIYLDLPDEILSKLRLDRNSATANYATLINFGIFTLSAIVGNWLLKS